MVKTCIGRIAICVRALGTRGSVSVPSVAWITPATGVAPFVPLSGNWCTVTPLGLTAKTSPKLFEYVLVL